MGWWTDHVVPRMTDATLSAPEIAALRAQACRPLGGRLLEIGFGSGLNLPHLPEAVTAVDAVEPSDVGWSRSADRRRTARLPVRRVGLDGQAIAAPDASYDSALVTFSLCTIPDPTLALTEVRRLLRPGGVLSFLEHGRSPDERVAAWQRRLDPIEKRVAGGCHLSRDIPALVRGAGFDVVALEERMLVAAPAVAAPWGHGFVGVAQAGAAL
ncbi:class I SAM-dependent methyltransferase [Nocardioides daphniae]|uniref:Methyltransferase n=1 Tax=Nocardioides daphniae TaxID=402297 RepID=A0A4P7UFZ9_9ACTN|nr:class I SAM-dependent methyltransferase [Nocardioides daphniae]QCC78325.1 class I SAM-dependent methyltransferase [Nocardioides daphniae]GGD13552.1 methyltransferase [Nocardioides daphniae]